ncbi:MAG: bifunctional demethylmenaquinone methyltransferase/2-methoxy-6-polyprenyl-1,4-benzoquinol methylase UbiE [candidate division Zixibacteria bacterium]|nr:bifunctional demethylmenaquinone methyltransferase/2-methoxy-6-polyprenyl-1,4-benzoquinol methylase UbiE [candidate division Zixibacteria bacterium]
MDTATMSTANPTDRGPSRENVASMFDRIAGRYDLLNHLLSANRDRSWRARMISHLPPGNELHVLDLATGTADQLLALYDSGRLRGGIGLDPAEQMLSIGRKKIAGRMLDSVLRLEKGRAERLPFDDNVFDAVTISFGIRNVSDVSTSLQEMRRVLKPGGRALILEFSLPSNSVLRRVYLWYFRSVLPRLGGIISGDRTAYRYLNRSVESFPYGEEFLGLLRAAGFSAPEQYPLTYGIATLYRADKK